MENLAVRWRQMMEARLENVHTWLPAVIVEFDHKRLRATVKPTINKVVGPDGNETRIPFEVIFEAPVDVAVLTEHFGLRPPYAVDDPVTLGFYERSCEEIIKDIEQRDPRFSRKHALTDALVVQGRLTDQQGSQRPFPDCWVNELILFHRDLPGTCFRMLPDGVMVMQVDPSAKLYVGSGGEGCTPGDVAVDYAILGTRHRNWAAAHQHTNVMPGGGLTGPPSVPPPATSSHVLIGE